MTAVSKSSTLTPLSKSSSLTQNSVRFSDTAPAPTNDFPRKEKQQHGASCPPPTTATATATATRSTPKEQEEKSNKETEVKWAKDATVFEYGSAANPDMKPIPVLVHPPGLHEKGRTRVIPFDASDLLDMEDTASMCTSPNLMASFLRINVGDGIGTQVPNATSQAFYVIRGSGTTQVTAAADEDASTSVTSAVETETISWKTGDLFVLPVTQGEMIHFCTSAESHGGAALYWVHDEPLMNYLGATPHVKKFEPTLYKKEMLLERVQRIRHESGECHRKNRLGVLLGNARCAQTKTLTHVLWSLLNSIPSNTVQRPHRHNSVALDLCVSSEPGVYTLMGKEIDSNGFIVDPIRCDWVTGGAFITPPGWWHSHHNESDKVAWVLPIQDAGLFTHQRTLDIRFVDDELKLHKEGRIRGSAFAITNKDYTEMVEIGAKVPDPGESESKKLNGLKRVLSAECFLTSKRLQCTQIGSHPSVSPTASNALPGGTEHDLCTK
jgi:gentisate 1,2-dioxygenase